MAGQFISFSSSAVDMCRGGLSGAMRLTSSPVPISVSPGGREWSAVETGGEGRLLLDGRRLGADQSSVLLRDVVKLSKVLLMRKLWRAGER